MPTEILTKLGTAFVWADTTDYSSSVSGLVRTEQLDLTSIAGTDTTAAARQGTKDDLGTTMAAQFRILVAIEFATAPTAGGVVDFYWAGSPITTAANANPGGTSGSDAAYTGTAGSSLDDSVKQLRYLGSLVVTADATTLVQYMEIGTITAEELGRFGMPVVHNKASVAFVADATEMYFALVPVIDESQEA